MAVISILPSPEARSGTHLSQMPPQMAIVADDPWQVMSKEFTSLDNQYKDYLIVPWQVWCSDPDQFNQMQHLGISFPNDGDLVSLIPHLTEFELIMLDFPVFTDGRSYSLAGALKRQYGYKGKLRARGDVLPDQVHFMWRCGFGSLEVENTELAETIIRRPMPFSAFYQSSVCGGEPVYKRR